MLTKERVIEIMEEVGFYKLTQKRAETNSHFQEKVNKRDSLIDRLVKTSNYYDEIYKLMRDASIKKPKGKEHLMLCFIEDLINKESHRLREMLHISIKLPADWKSLQKKYKKTRHAKKKRVARIASVSLAIGILSLGIGPTKCFSQIIKPADMEKIKQIESGGNPFAYNSKSGARGFYQLTKSCLEDWNIYHPRDKYTPQDLFRSNANYKIAHWYLCERIPQMLRHYGLEVNLDNILIAYNFGIGNLVKGKKLPKETINYLRKFRGMK